MRNVLIPASTAAIAGSCASARAKSRALRSDVRVLVAPGAPHGDAAEHEDGDEGEDLVADGAAVPVDADVCDRHDRSAVEDPLRARRPHRDALSLLAPGEEDEVCDRENEGDAREDVERGHRLLELEDDDQPGDRREDQQTPHERINAREEAHVAVKYARTASAPATKVAPVNQASRPRRSTGAYIQGASTASSDSVP